MNMRLTKEQVKKWLKKNNHDRAWLAEQCHVSKATVNTWLSSDRGIPSKAELIIQNLIDESARQPGSKPAEPSSILPYLNERGKLEIRMDYETQKRVESESLRLNMELSTYCTLAVEWCCERPNIGKELSELLKEKNREQKVPAMEKHTENSYPETEQKDIYAEEESRAPAYYETEILGNIAAGGLMEGDSVPEPVRIYRPLQKGEYVVRVNGRSMEPTIPDGSHIVLKKYYGSDIPKEGTIVEYNDGRGVTLKRLGKRGGDYVFESVNPAYPVIEPMDGGCISALYVETLPE